MAPTRRRAFTLVELLVVIGIITLLIALLMPAIARARKQAIRLQCAANLRSQGQALMTYAQQHGCYPMAETENVHGGVVVWVVQLWQLMGENQQVFNCPERDERYWLPSRRIHPAFPPMFFMAFGGSVPFSYGYNVAGTDIRTLSRGIGGMLDERGHWTEVKTTRVRAPAEMIAITDSCDTHEPPFVPDCFVVVPFPPTIPGGTHSLRLYQPAGVHGGKVNVLFCDGHVEPFEQPYLTNIAATTVASCQVRRMWNSDHEL